MIYTTNEVQAAIDKLTVDAAQWKNQFLISGSEYSKEQHLKCLERIDFLQNRIIDTQASDKIKL